jgi:hypothetical protein
MTARRTGAIVAGVAGIGIGLARLLTAFQDDPSSSTSLPSRDPGDAVPGEVLTDDEVCALLRPADLREIYGLAFRRGQPIGSTTPTSAPTGEPSDASTETGACSWSSPPGESPVELVVLSLPPLVGGDANATYERLRPVSPIQGFDTTTEVGDEAFVRVSLPDDEGPSVDRMAVRSGGVILDLTITADIEPEGGLDSLVEVAQSAVENLPPTG